MKSTARDSALKAVFYILKPLVRLLMRHGIAHSEFAEVARRAYVDVAEKDFSIEGRKQTTSRIAVLTGLSRKEVVRLRELMDSKQVEEKGPINRATRVISGWCSDGEFQTDTGEPAVLDYSGETASFTALVKRYSGDITAGAILDELLRVGAVSKSGNRVELCAQAYVPQHDEMEKLKVMQISAADFLNTLNHNIESDGEGARLQREVIYHQLTPETAAAFEAYQRRKAERFTQDLNTWLKQHKSEQTEAGTVRAGVGVYYIQEQQREAPAKDE